MMLSRERYILSILLFFKCNNVEQSYTKKIKKISVKEYISMFSYFYIFLIGNIYVIKKIVIIYEKKEEE